MATRVDAWGNLQSGTTNTSIAAPAHAVSVGDFLIIGSSSRPSTTSPTLASSLGNTYAQIGTVGATVVGTVWAGFVTIAGNETLTAGWTGSGAGTINVLRWRGIAGTTGSNALDVAVVTNNASGTALTSGNSAVTVNAYDVVVAFSAQAGTSTYPPSPISFSPVGLGGFPVPDIQQQTTGTDNNQSFFSSTLSGAAGTAQSFSLTFSATAAWVCILAVFRNLYGGSGDYLAPQPRVGLRATQTGPISLPYSPGFVVPSVWGPSTFVPRPIQVHLDRQEPRAFNGKVVEITPKIPPAVATVIVPAVRPLQVHLAAFPTPLLVRTRSQRTSALTPFAKPPVRPLQVRLVSQPLFTPIPGAKSQRSSQHLAPLIPQPRPIQRTLATLPWKVRISEGRVIRILPRTAPLIPQPRPLQTHLATVPWKVRVGEGRVLHITPKIPPPVASVVVKAVRPLEVKLAALQWQLLLTGDVIQITPRLGQFVPPPPPPPPPVFGPPGKLERAGGRALHGQPGNQLSRGSGSSLHGQPGNQLERSAAHTLHKQTQ